MFFSYNYTYQVPAAAKLMHRKRGITTTHYEIIAEARKPGKANQKRFLLDTQRGRPTDEEKKRWHTLQSAVLQGVQETSLHREFTCETQGGLAATAIQQDTSGSSRSHTRQTVMAGRRHSAKTTRQRE